MRAWSILLAIAVACTEPVPVAQDAGPTTLGVVTPDSVCPGPGCQEGGTSGIFRIGVGSRSIVPSAYELINTAYLDSRRSEVCDPGTPRLGAGHKHRLAMTAAQLAQIAGGETLTVQSEATHDHTHEIALSGDVAAGLNVNLLEAKGHTHALEVGPFVEAVDPQVVWMDAARIPRCGELRRGFNDFPSTDCGLDGLCDGDPCGHC